MTTNKSKTNIESGREEEIEKIKCLKQQQRIRRYLRKTKSEQKNIQRSRTHTHAHKQYYFHWLCCRHFLRNLFVFVVTCFQKRKKT